MYTKCLVAVFVENLQTFSQCITFQMKVPMELPPPILYLPRGRVPCTKSVIAFLPLRELFGRIFPPSEYKKNVASSELVWLPSRV